MGERAFQGVYSLVALILFGAMIYFYRVIGREPPLWDAGEAGWIAGTILMWLGSILFVGSFVGNPALPGARGPTRRSQGRVHHHPPPDDVGLCDLGGGSFDGRRDAQGARVRRRDPRPRARRRCRAGPQEGCADGRGLARMDRADRLHPVHPGRRNPGDGRARSAAPCCS